MRIYEILRSAGYGLRKGGLASRGYTALGRKILRATGARTFSTLLQGQSLEVAKRVAAGAYCCDGCGSLNQGEGCGWVACGDCGYI